jgi:membrane dipeptidase
MHPAIRLDSHVDTLHEFHRREMDDYDLHKETGLQVDIPKLRCGGVNAMFWALFSPEKLGPMGGRDRIKELLQIFRKIVKENKVLKACYSPEDTRETVECGLIALSLGMENGTPVGIDLNRLDYYFYLGVRYMTLCHNYPNQICDSSTSDKIHSGLSDFGKKVVKRMNELGMMIDVSHASDDTVSQVLDISERPIVASHSNSKSIYDNPRNLSDELIARIANNDGVVQVSALPKCVGAWKIVWDMISHIDYIADKFGVDHVGIGTDFDGGGRLAGFEHIGLAQKITDSLKHRGLSDEDINKIWGENFMRVYEANCK